MSLAFSPGTRSPKPRDGNSLPWSSAATRCCTMASILANKAGDRSASAAWRKGSSLDASAS